MNPHAELMENFVDDLEDLCVGYELTLQDVIDGLIYSLADAVSQLTDGEYDEELIGSTQKWLGDCYKSHCGFDESANITIQ